LFSSSQKVSNESLRPYITILSRDAALSRTVRVFVNENKGQKLRIGRATGARVQQDLEVDGIGIASEACILWPIANTTKTTPPPSSLLAIEEALPDDAGDDGDGGGEGVGAVSASPNERGRVVHELSYVFQVCAASPESIVFVNGKELEFDQDFDLDEAVENAAAAADGGGVVEGGGPGATSAVVSLKHNDRIAIGHCAYIFLVVDPSVLAVEAKKAEKEAQVAYSVAFDEELTRLGGVSSSSSSSVAVESDATSPPSPSPSTTAAAAAAAAATTTTTSGRGGKGKEGRGRGGGGRSGGGRGSGRGGGGTASSKKIQPQQQPPPQLTPKEKEAARQKKAEDDSQKDKEKVKLASAAKVATAAGLAAAAPFLPGGAQASAVVTYDQCVTEVMLRRQEGEQEYEERLVAFVVQRWRLPATRAAFEESLLRALHASQVRAG
jgi:hypothetical protein